MKRKKLKLAAPRKVQFSKEFDKGVTILCNHAGKSFSEFTEILYSNAYDDLVIRIEAHRSSPEINLSQSASESESVKNEI